MSLTGNSDRETGYCGEGKRRYPFLYETKNDVCVAYLDAFAQRGTAESGR